MKPIIFIKLASKAEKENYENFGIKRKEGKEFKPQIIDKELVKIKGQLSIQFYQPPLKLGDLKCSETDLIELK